MKKETKLMHKNGHLRGGKIFNICITETGLANMGRYEPWSTVQLLETAKLNTPDNHDWILKI